MTVIDEWGETWKGAAVVYFKVLAQCLPKISEKIHENLLGQPVSDLRIEMKPTEQKRVLNTTCDSSFCNFSTCR
jgi:hypothetical protein